MREYTCDNCANPFERYPSQVTGENKFCSPECSFEWQRGRDAPEDHNFRRGGKVMFECDYCGNQEERYPSEIDLSERNFCDKECHRLWQKYERPTEEHNWYNGGMATVECAWCGDELKRRPCKLKRSDVFFCGDGGCEGRWKSENIRGEDHPLWDGGYVEYYGPNWNEQKRKALQRDQNRCQICGDSENEIGQRPDVHHVKKIKWFKRNYDAPEWYEKGNRLENLITYCRSCHMKWEGIELKPQRAVA